MQVTLWSSVSHHFFVQETHSGNLGNFFFPLNLVCQKKKKSSSSFCLLYFSFLFLLFWFLFLAVDAAMLLTALQPVARELSALAALVHAESEAQDVHPMQLDPHTLVLSEEKRTQVMVKVREISVYCTCWWYSLCTFQYRQHYEKTGSYNFEC